MTDAITDPPLSTTFGHTGAIMRPGGTVTYDARAERWLGDGIGEWFGWVGDALTEAGDRRWWAEWRENGDAGPRWDSGPVFETFTQARDELLARRGEDGRARGGDRGGAAARYVPLDHQRVADLTVQMSIALGPATLTDNPDPLALAAWKAKQILSVIARLIDPDEEEAGGDRAGWLDTIAGYGDDVRRAAHRQWACEASPAELARFTENTAITEATDTAMIDGATVHVLLPDGRAGIEVHLSTAADHGDAGPRGWTTWTSNSPLPLAPIDGEGHLEITRLLAGLSAVITPALHPALLEDDEQ